MPPLPGIHHVTALSGDAQDNLDFYTGVLGLRLVKTTVNFDDPTTYHLYYGDGAGQPGTILTFFPWPHAVQGRAGAGMATAVAFSAPEDSMDDWTARLRKAGCTPKRSTRFGEDVLAFSAPDGLPLEIVATADAPDSAVWTDGPVSGAMALRGFHGTTLPALNAPKTQELFEDVLGWDETGRTDDRIRLAAPGTAPGRTVDLHTEASAAGRMGRGTVHHVAFRVPDDEAQMRIQEALRERSIGVTDVKDRRYFRSIYFRDPKWTSGVLFEVATDGPGFLRDESEADLGTGLKLPPWLEERRSEIENALPPLQRP